MGKVDVLSNNFYRSELEAKFVYPFLKIEIPGKSETQTPHGHIFGLLLTSFLSISLTLVVSLAIPSFMNPNVDPK